jgi:UDPglucose--hexose-1-phosphate uridylyltransferase
MPYNELRKDYLLDRWVVIATERGRRPTDFAKTKAPADTAATCPMCVGNENLTPPATLLYLKEGDKIVKSQDPQTGERPKNWQIRCIPNLYPAFTPPQLTQDAKNMFPSPGFGYAVGHHEVLVESPKHDENPANADLPQLELVIKAYIDRLKALSSKSHVKYVSIFRNHGLEAGASLSHAHSQIIATPMVPTTIREEVAACQAHYEDQGECIYCDIIKTESKGPRMVMDSKDFSAIAPYASINPMEFWILPKRHMPSISFLNEGEIASFAKTLKATLKALKDLVNDPPYNYGLHLVIGGDALETYHWHLEVYPKLVAWAGFEKSTGIYINTVAPETAAEALRKQIKP